MTKPRDYFIADFHSTATARAFPEKEDAEAWCENEFTDDYEIIHVREVLPNNGWLDIKDAPRDGRKQIYLWGPNYEGPILVWSNTWWTTGFSAETKPSHWMPYILPKPPKE